MLHRAALCSLFLGSFYAHELFGAIEDAATPQENLSTSDNDSYAEHANMRITGARSGGYLFALTPKDIATNQQSHPAGTMLPKKRPQETTSSCGDSPRPMRVTMRHIEANGVGYNQGYTTLEGFFAPLTLWKDTWVPFLDLRGHLFNSGKPAANAGIGVRYLATSRIWGVNAYYDYRKTNRHHYNQVSLGLESLGKIWDFRINGYLPVGDKKSSFFNAKFDEFDGHYMILAGKREFAMKGANAEIGAHVNNSKNAPLYIAAGPYYLEGQGRAAWGGQARIALDVFDYVRLEGNTSYDNVFKWIGQGQLSLIIPFGGKREIKQRRGNSCSMELTLSRRALQRVDRNEIIPVDKRHRKEKAINPATGRPYFFWFVDNTSHSAGTFESPFNTLVAAQNASFSNDVIYVFPGDGTSTGMSAGITLKNAQRLFGAGIDQHLSTTAGEITIPAQASGTPQITNLTSPVIACANNNEISGLHVLGTNILEVISCTGVTNTSIHNNTLDLTLSVALQGSSIVGLKTTGGQISIVDNTFNITNPHVSGGFSCDGIRLFSTASNATYLFANNQFISPVSQQFTTGIEFGDPTNIPLGDFNSITISNNGFFNIGSAGVGRAIAGFGFGGTGAILIDQNTFSHTDGSIATTGIALLRIRAGGNLTATITNNLWENSESLTRPSLKVINQTSTSSSCVTLKNNTSDVTSNAYVLDNSFGGTMRADISGNVGTVQEITVTSHGSCP
ncbi:MAG: inverse autotransporter beta domain-containing protein [Chlamydiales bacterium]|nr:inverse autotransporter beta domain-containing protein [Chlamydiales bacterium]